jgi:ACS family D-galactonate transporter-like MFS transporter
MNRQIPRATIPGATWVVVGLLFISAIINFIDRGSLSVAAPSLSGDLGLSPSQTGIILSAFFWSYSIFQLVFGWLIDRYPVRKVFAAGFFIWSFATLGTGFAGGMFGLILWRLLLGIGESVAVPTYSKVIASEFAPSKRGLPNSLLEAGTKLGPGLGTLIGGWLIASYGWRMLFIGLGLGSLAWLIPWLIWGPTTAGAVKSERPIETAGIADILRRRDAWGTFIGNACYSYEYYFLLTWLPSYLVKERHVSIAMMGVLGSLPFWGAAVAAVLSGWLSDAWIKRGATPTLVRKTFVATGLLLSTVMVPSVIVSDLKTSMGLLIVAYIAFGIFASNHWAISQTLAGPSAAGKWAGIQNTLGSLAAVAAPMVTGFIVEKTGSFYWAFVTPAVLAVAGTYSYLFIVRRVEALEWAVPASLAGQTR